MKQIPFKIFLLLLLVPGVYAQTNDVPKIKTIKAPKPEFPAEANNIIYGDAVDVQFIVNKEGKVTEAFAYGPLAPCSNFKDTTAIAIAKAAVDATRAMVFEPILKNGKPVELGLTTTYKLPVIDPPVREDPSSGRKALYLAKPEYKAEAKAKNIQGEVKILVLIDEQGNVLSAGALSGAPLLLAGAVGPSCKARFAKHSTKAIGVVTYRFVLGY